MSRLHVPRAAWPVALLGAVITLVLVDPGRAGRAVDCPFHTLTGLLCPGCGALRAAHRLLHGNLGAALHLNALAVLVLPVLVVVALAPFAPLPWQARLQRLLHSPATSRACLVAVLAFWAARNVPLLPSSLMR